MSASFAQTSNEDEIETFLADKDDDLLNVF